MALFAMMNYRLILASGSPRRQEMLRALRLAFEVRIIPVDEDYPDTLAVDQVAVYLAKKKGQAYRSSLADDELVITADTTVVVGKELLNKPTDAADARRMLNALSGQMHRVITGVSLTTKTSVTTFSDTTRVYFRPLTPDEVDFYVAHYQPYDKAGGYAIQEWMGMIGIEKVEGSYFNVVGLPTEKLYRKLQEVTPLAFTGS